MNPEEMNVTAMQWKPELIRLTYIGNPDWMEGKPTTCFIDPAVITSITRAVASFGTRADPKVKHPDVECTAVFYCHGTMHVLESPEQVALLRDRALGHKTGPKAA